MEITFGNRRLIEKFTNLPARNKLAQNLNAAGIDSSKVIRTYAKPADKEALNNLISKVGTMIREDKPSKEIFKVVREFAQVQKTEEPAKRGFKGLIQAISNSFKAKEAMDKGMSADKINRLFFNV